MIADAHEAAEAAHDTPGVAKTFAADGVLDPKPTGQRSMALTPSAPGTQTCSLPSPTSPQR